MAVDRRIIQCPECEITVLASIWDGNPVPHNCTGRLFLEILPPRIPYMGTCTGCRRRRRLFGSRITRHKPKPLSGIVTPRQVWERERCWEGGPPLEILPALLVIAEADQDAR